MKLKNKQQTGEMKMYKIESKECERKMVKKLLRSKEMKFNNFLITVGLYGDPKKDKKVEKEWKQIAKMHNCKLVYSYLGLQMTSYADFSVELTRKGYEIVDALDAMTPDTRTIIVTNEPLLSTCNIGDDEMEKFVEQNQIVYMKI